MHADGLKQDSCGDRSGLLTPKEERTSKDFVGAPFA
jgi:hypothetical protein